MGVRASDERRAASRSAVVVRTAPRRSMYSIRPSTWCRSSDCQKAGSRAAGECVLLRFVPRAGRARTRTRAGSEEEGGLRVGSFRLERDATEGEVAQDRLSLGGRRRLRPARVGVDEGDVEPLAVARGDEEELVARGELALDDRGASGASRCCSTARFSGRAPSSGAEALLEQEVDRASSHSTAQGRMRKPRRSSTAVSSFSSSVAHHVAPERRNTTTRSSRLRNSGRNERSTRVHAAASNGRARRRSRAPGRSGSPSRRSR